MTAYSNETSCGVRFKREAANFRWIFHRLRAFTSERGEKAPELQSTKDLKHAPVSCYYTLAPQSAQHSPRIFTYRQRPRTDRTARGGGRTLPRARLPPHRRITRISFSARPVPRRPSRRRSPCPCSPPRCSRGPHSRRPSAPQRSRRNRCRRPARGSRGRPRRPWNG